MDFGLVLFVFLTGGVVGLALGWKAGVEAGRADADRAAANNRARADCPDCGTPLELRRADPPYGCPTCDYEGYGES
jgi:ribosomal protein L37AE/L43A